MKAHRILMLAGVLAVTTAGAAAASTINSVFLYAQGADFLFCSAVNVSSAPITTVTLDMIDNFGAVIGTKLCSNLAPADNCGFSSANAAHARCRATIAGSKTKVRAFFEIDDNTSSTKVGFPLN